MIPILYDKGETAFTSNGRCRLVDCLSCLVTEERNGIYECEFSYPVTGRNYAKITLGSIICTTHDDTRTPQPFDIYKRTTTIEGVVTFYARHIAYRLSNVILKPFTAGSCALTMAALTANSLTANPFTFWTDKQVSGDYHLGYPRSVWDILGGSQGSILDVYGKGTYEFDKWTVKLHLNRGRQTDVSIRYGKNLTELEHTRDADGLHNSVVPFWRSSEGDTVVTVPGWFVTAPNTYTTEYLTDDHLEVIVDEANVPIEVRSSAGDVVSIMDLSDAFEEAPTAEQLRQLALERITDSNAWVPEENLKINFTQLWQTSEYANVAALQRLALCDTVNVVFPEIGLTAEHVQIIKVVYDSLLERYDSMELGQPAVTLASLIRQDVERSILKQVPSTSAMAQAIDAATQLITGGSGGHVVIATDANGKPNEILIMDTADINTAVKVLRINMNGIGFSSTGYQGPFTTAWTLNGGFVADFITTGTLRGNLLQAGSVTADKLNVEDLFSQNITTTGTFQIENENYSLLVNDEWMGMTFYAFDEQAHTGCQLIMKQAGQADLYCSSGLSLRSNGDVSIQAGSSGPVQIYGQECILHGNVSVVQNGNLYPGNLSVSGDVNASGKLAASVGIIEGGTALEDRYSKKLTVDSVTIPLPAQAGKAQKTSSSVVKSGKTALAVAGHRLSGSYATFQNVYELYVSNNVCYCGIRNTSSTDFSGTITVYILYVAD